MTNTDRPQRIGIIAGRGDLPRHIIAALQSSGRDFFVLAIEGQAEPATVAGVAHAWVGLGQVGYGFATLKAAGVGLVVFAGAVKRPSLFSLKLDAKGAALIAKIGIRSMGDDGLLRAVSDAFEEEGFAMVGADELLKSLVVGEGSLGRFKPDALAMNDLQRGLQVALALGTLDVGQAVVVQQGIVLGVEAIEGTDALIDRATILRRDGLGGVLVKVMKPGQDRRFDLPTLGPETVSRAAAAGLRGIGFEAGSVIILNQTEAVARADAAGIFLHGLAAAK
ncbi:MAG: UDP-2,3-diacylglucosamine diphosphatase LpxI [Candidatus Pacebacteria bacterium]|nr:UDP-2,3-diacylglucosamine diphosphatase LpxI [Candidatus Paceibacterota bacterium]